MDKFDENDVRCDCAFRWWLQTDFQPSKKFRGLCLSAGHKNAARPMGQRAAVLLLS